LSAMDPLFAVGRMHDGDPFCIARFSLAGASKAIAYRCWK